MKCPLSPFATLQPHRRARDILPMCPHTESPNRQDERPRLEFASFNSFCISRIAYHKLHSAVQKSICTMQSAIKRFRISGTHPLPTCPLPNRDAVFFPARCIQGIGTNPGFHLLRHDDNAVLIRLQNIAGMNGHAAVVVINSPHIAYAGDAATVNFLWTCVRSVILTASTSGF